MERARGKKQYATWCGHSGAEAGEFAIAAQRRRRFPTGFREGRRIGNDDVKTLARGGEPGRLGKCLATLKAAEFGHTVKRSGLGGERQGRLGAINAKGRGGARTGGLYREGAGEAIEVEHTATPCQSGDEPPVVALVEEPAGLLPGEQVGAEQRATFME